MSKPTASPAEPQPRYVTVNTRSGETAHIRISKVHHNAGYLLLDGYVDHKKGRNYNCERIFAQLYFIESDDEYHDAVLARHHLKADCLIELKDYTQAEWSDITYKLSSDYDADSLLTKTDVQS
jgi:hypothetical protein